MFKIPMNTLTTIAFQPTRGKVDKVLRRLLAPASTSLEFSTTDAAAVQMGRNGGCYYYHSQTFSQQKSATAADTPMALPSNLMFDFKSSFAPQKEASEIASSSFTADDEEEDDGSNDQSESDNTQLSDDDLNDDYMDDGEDDDEMEEKDLALVFRANAQRHHHRQVQPLPDRLQMPIQDGPSPSEEAVGSIWLDPTVFGVQDIRVDLISQNVNYIRNKIRGFRKAKSKTISEKSGSGRKVRNQKGGGIARAGHSRPAHWRGGAKAHGPKNTKNYGNTKLNKRVKALAMRSMLSQKLKEGNLVVVNHLHLDSHKTGPWARTLETKYGVGKALKKYKLRNNSDIFPTTSALILDHYMEPEENEEDPTTEETDYHASYHGVPINLWVASSNIPRVTVRNHRFLNVYDCLKNEKLIITLAALEQIEEKWKE